VAVDQHGSNMIMFDRVWDLVWRELFEQHTGKFRIVENIKKVTVDEAL